MAVTVNNGTQTPVVGAETTIATIAGGPFDNVSVYFTGGLGGAGGAIGVNLYATVNGVPSRVASTQVQGTSVGTLIEFADTSNGATGTTSQSANQNTTFVVDAGATTYTVKVIDLSTTPIPPGGSARASCTVTLAGVNSSDTAADAPVGSTFAGLGAGATGTCTIQAGYAVQMDVAVTQAALLPATVTVTADCGVGSVSAVVKAQQFTGVGGAGLFAIFRNLHLPVAVNYTVSLTNNGTAAGNWAVTSITYSGATGGGGAVVLSPEVTGLSNANVLSGPFSTASLAWKANVASPTWTQLQAAAGAGAVMTIEAQAAAAASGLAGGALQLAGGIGDGAGVNGSVLFLRPSDGTVVGSVEPTHGRITAGGDGTDGVVVMGPLPGSLTFGAVALPGNGTAMSATNYFVTSAGGSPNLNSPVEALGTDFQFSWAGGAPRLKFTSDGATTTLLWSAAVAAAIAQTASAGAPTAMTITGQAAGGASVDGGALALAGGAHNGVGADGSVKITTPANMGFLSIGAVAPLNLTNAQSDKNVLILTGAPPGGFQVNFLREITDTSLVFIKNTSTQTATIAYLAGGTVTIATNTSALVCSDGANLQKIMTAT